MHRRLPFIPVSQEKRIPVILVFQVNFNMEFTSQVVKFSLNRIAFSKIKLFNLPFG